MCSCSGRLAFLQISLCLCQDSCKEIRFPPPKQIIWVCRLMGCSQNTKWHQVRFSLWNKPAIVSTIIDLVILKRKTSNTTFWKKWLELLTKSHCQWHQRAGRVKGQEVKIVTRDYPEYTESHCSKGLALQ